MAYFRFEYEFLQRFYTLLGVISEFDEKIYFSVEDVIRLVRKNKGQWSGSRPMDTVLTNSRLPDTLPMIEYGLLLNVLEKMKTPASLHLYFLLERGSVRDQHYQHGRFCIVQCEDFEGQSFQAWLKTFKQNYGPFYQFKKERIIELGPVLNGLKIVSN